MHHNLLLLTILLVSLIYRASALQEVAKCEVNAVVAKKCGGTTPNSHPDCCFASPGTCAITYTVRGNWISEVEAAPSFILCKNLCGKHFRACRNKCKCVTSRRAIRDRELCKCIPNDLPLIKKGCDLACKIGRKRCIQTCKLGGPCAKATTNVSFFRSFPGRCGRISCGPKFIGVRPRVCPVCSADGKCAKVVKSAS